MTHQSKKSEKAPLDKVTLNLMCREDHLGRWYEIYSIQHTSPLYFQSAKLEEVTSMLKTWIENTIKLNLNIQITCTKI